jgi:hypothetical protein
VASNAYYLTKAVYHESRAEHQRTQTAARKLHVFAQAPKHIVAELRAAHAAFTKAGHERRAAVVQRREAFTVLRAHGLRDEKRK